MEREKIIQQDKRKQEREYFDRIIDENKRNKVIALEEKEKQRLQDIKSMKAYASMLDQ